MDLFAKGILQGSVPVIVLVGGTHHLVKKFRESKPVLYWGSLAVATGVAVAIVQGRIPAPFMKAETFEAESSPVIWDSKRGQLIDPPMFTVWIGDDTEHFNTFEEALEFAKNDMEEDEEAQITISYYETLKKAETFEDEGDDMMMKEVRLRIDEEGTQFTPTWAIEKKISIKYPYWDDSALESVVEGMGDVAEQYAIKNNNQD